MNRFLMPALMSLALASGAFDIAADAADKAKVAMTVNLDGLSKLKFKFRAYDPVTGKALDKTVKVSPPVGKKKPRTGFYMPGISDISFKLPAGDWFLDSIQAEVQKDFNVTRVITASYGAGTFAFHVEPGTTRHLGNYRYGTSLITNTASTPPSSTVTPATFSCDGKANLEVTAYCEPETLTPKTDGTLTLTATSHEVLKRVRPQLDPIWAKTKPDYTQPEDKETPPDDK